MGFATPIYLLLLIPWTAAVVWVLLGRTRYAHVSSLQFWESTDVAAAPRRALRKPPLPIVMMLLAALLAVLAAAGLGWRGSVGKRLTVIVDRGVLSAAAIAKDPAAVHRQLLATAPANTPIDLVLMPGDAIRETDVSDIGTDLAHLRPSGTDTTKTLPQTVMRELARTGQEIVVISAQPLAIDDPRVHVLQPPTSLANAGIDVFAVTEGTTPQALVRVFNATAQARATLRVNGVETPIDLPSAGESRDYFVDLPSLPRTATATLVIADDIAADNVAYLAQRQSWPRLEPTAPLSPGLRRLVDVYARQRPPNDASRRVIVTETSNAPPADVAAAVVATPGAGAKVRFAPVSAETGHPLVRDVAWQRLVKDATIQPPKGNGWKTIVRADEQPLVAIRENPSRQVWVAIDSPAWSQEADYVVFWTNVFDWLGGGAANYATEPAGDLPADWERREPAEPPAMDAAPGIYQAPDGLHARSLAAVRPTTAPAASPSAFSTATIREFRTVAPWLLLPAMLCLLVGVWRGASLTRF
jgi:hypothetical protein